MTGETRALMFKVMDGRAEVLPYLHHFTHYKKCDLILKWLIQARITGKEFLDWSTIHFGNSLMGPAKFILGKIAKEGEPARILVGRDWI